MKFSRIGKLAATVGMVSLLGAAPQHAGATVILNGCGGASSSFGTACGLDELLGGGSLVINDKRFSGFTLDLFSGRPLNASVVRVDPLDTLYNPGFTLVDTGNTLRAVNGDATQNDFSFNVTVVSGPLRIKDNSLAVGIGDVTGDGSFINISEDVFTQGLMIFVGHKNVFCDTTTSCANTTGTDLATFNPITGVSILAAIDVVSQPGGVAEINSINMRFSQVPEPGSLALLALGVAGIGFSPRRGRTAA